MKQAEKHQRPGVETEALSVSLGGDSTNILPQRPLENPKAIAAGWAVLLVRKDERVSRQVYLSLHSATKALERAKANGRQARMVLVELVPSVSAPVYVVGGEDR